MSTACYRCRLLLLLLLLQDLNALGDVAGKVSKGLQCDAIQQLPQVQVGQLRQQHCNSNSSSSGCCGGSSATQQQMQQLAQKALAAASM
jgi:hypothetical protein